MHRSFIVMLALLTAIPAVPTGAQTPAPAAPAVVVVLEDNKGDVVVGSPGPPATNPTPRLGQLDLVGASVQEQATDLLFNLQVASLDDSSEPPLGESAFYLLHFLHGDVSYAIQIGRIKSQQTGLFAVLERYDPAEDRYYAIDSVPVTSDKATATFTITAGRDLIVDSRGAKPYPGLALSQFWAESQSFMEIFLSPTSFAGAPPPTIRDRMPDGGTGTTSVPIILGPVQVGSARLSSQLPTRQSNGEASTFVFTVEARNVGDHEDRYSMSAIGVPAAWKANVPSDLISLGPGEALSLPVLVTVPFAHKHGSFQSFLLRLESTTDAASHAEMELGIRYPKVPQPAGHHSLVWLHGAKFTDDPTIPVYAAAFGFNIEYAWMNALQEDPGDQRVPVPADPGFDFVASVPDTFRWAVPLAPDLALGLDFDEASTGTFTGSFQATTPLLAASLTGELVYYVDSRFDRFGTRTGGNKTVLARLATSAAKDLQSGAMVPFSLELTPTPAADLIAYRARSSLVLELNLTGSRPDTFVARDPPKLMPGATLLLPLFEYHDPVDASFAATMALTLHAATAQDRMVNPGETVVYQVGARLAATAGSHELTATLSGSGIEWARLLGETRRTVGPGEAWNFSVAVAVPASAAKTDAIDLVVRVEAADDPSLRSLLRLYGTVTTEPDLPDEAGLADSLDDSGAAATPGPTMPLLALGLAVAAVGARRLRRETR